MTAPRGDFDRPSAAVPDPRFRDKLAEALPQSLQPVGCALRYPPEFGEPDPLTGYGHMILDALLPVVAAEVARVKADSEKRAAEARRIAYGQGFEQGHFDARMDIATGRAVCPCGNGSPVQVVDVNPAALAQPAPAPADEEGEPPQHNHVTRDVKRPGVCPACDRWHKATRR